MSNQRKKECESVKGDNSANSAQPSNSCLNHNQNYRYRKRRFPMVCIKSYSEKRRKKNNFKPPTHFLLGGNKHDPLNLKSIENNGSNQSSNNCTELSPNTLNKEIVDVLIPPNLNDPLNLAHSESLHESDLIPITSSTLIRQTFQRTRTSSESDIYPKTSTTEQKRIIKDDSFVNYSPSSSTQSYTGQEIDHNRSFIQPTVPSRFRKNNHKQQPHYSQCDKRKFNRRNPHNEESQHKSSLSNSKKNGKERFQYGNYNRYYGYRNVGTDQDPRIQMFSKELFEGKDVLDIGCNVGHITLTIGRDFSPRKIVGIDIDSTLIESAKKNVRHYLPKKKDADETKLFPKNVQFFDGNYVGDSDEIVKNQTPEYDTILCLSITKWIHLNWADAGVKRFFKRIYAHLRPGGCMILEPQPWSSYHKKSKITPTTLQNFRSIRFKPEHFNEYLLRDVGFKICELLGTPQDNSKGFQRPIYVYKK